MAATAWNLKKMMEKFKEEFLFFLFSNAFSNSDVQCFTLLNVNF